MWKSWRWSGATSSPLMVIGCSESRMIPFDELEVERVEGDHRVYEPQEVWAVEEPDGFVSAVQVVRPDGTRDVARVRRADTRSEEER